MGRRVSSPARKIGSLADLRPGDFIRDRRTQRAYAVLEIDADHATLVRIVVDVNEVRGYELLSHADERRGRS